MKLEALHAMVLTEDAYVKDTVIHDGREWKVLGVSYVRDIRLLQFLLYDTKRGETITVEITATKEPKISDPHQ
jgi:hypothetical protein